MTERVEVRFDGVSRGARRAAEEVRREVGRTTDSVEKDSKRFVLAGKVMRKALLAVAAGAAAVAAGAVIAFKKSIDAASNLGEQINKASVVFRGSERLVLEWSKTTANALGVSRRAALEYAGTFGNMLVPMGFARDEAAKMSTTIVDLAADMASFNNASPEETLEALRAGLAGETEPLRRFGVFLNEARVRQEALNLGLVKGNEDLTAAGKAAAIYSIILKDTKDAQGDVARTSDSWANTSRRIRAQLEDLAAFVGAAFLPMVERAGNAVSDFLGRESTQQRARELADLIANGLSRAIVFATAFFKTNGATMRSILRGVWDVVRLGVSVFDDVLRASDRVARTLGGWRPTLITLTTAWIAYKVAMTAAMVATRVQAIITSNTIKAALISTGIGAVIVALGVAVGLIIAHWDKVRGATRALGERLAELWARFFNWLVKTAITVALKVVEPFSHLPGKLGGWARDAKDRLNAELDRMAVDAAVKGEKIGDALGRSMFNAQAAWLEKMAAGRTAYAGGGTGGALQAARASGGLRGIFPEGTAGVSIGGGPGAGTHAAGDWQSGNAFDVFAKPGTNVLSPVNGTVVKVSGRDPSLGTVAVGNKRIYGYAVTISGGSDATTFYLAHLDAVTVRQGQRVTRGQVIGKVAAWKGGSAHVHVAQPWGITPGSGIAAGGEDTAADASAAAAAAAAGVDPFDVSTTSATTSQARASAAKPKKTETEKAAEAAAKARETEIKRARKAADLIREQAVDVSRAISRLPEDTRRALTPKMQALRKELQTVTTDAGIRRLKADLAKIQEAVKAAIQRLEQAVANRREAFGRAFGRLAEKALSVFDAKTDELIRRAQARADDLDAALREETPAEAELRAFRDAREGERRAQERAEALALEDPVERARRLRELDLAEQERTLEDRAALERRALEERIQAERQAREEAAEAERNRILDERALMRERFQMRLDEIREGFANEELTADEAQRRLLELMESYGIDYQAAGALIGEYFATGFRDALRDVADAVNDLRRAINDLRVATGKAPLSGSGVSITTSTPAATSAARAISQARKQVLMARGGRVPGQYVGLDDTILMRATPGEEVLDRELSDALRRALVTGGLGGGGVAGPSFGPIYVLGSTPDDVARALARVVRDAGLIGYDLEAR